MNPVGTVTDFWHCAWLAQSADQPSQFNGNTTIFIYILDPPALAQSVGLPTGAVWLVNTTEISIKSISPVGSAQSVASLYGSEQRDYV